MLVGFFLGELVELLGAVILTAAMWLVGWVTWREIRPHVADATSRTLLGVAAAVLVATMALAVSWAVGEAFGTPHLPIEWMAATHGVANAFGFAVCALLAWLRLRVSPV